MRQNDCASIAMKKRSDAAIRGEAFVHVYGTDCAQRLEAIAAERGADVEEVDADNFDGALLRYEDEALGLILLRRDIKEASRKRFTLAHELAHYLLPGHGAEPLHCRQQDIESWDENIANYEREANTFAAEVLMPTSVVMPLLKRPPSFDTVRAIAQQCGSSLTASAYRLVELSTWRVAMVWSVGGAAKWYQPSDEFPFTIKRGPLDANTFAADCFAGATIPDQFEEVTAEAWLSSYNLKAGAMLKEHSRCLPNYDAALTLLYTDEFIEYKSDYETD
jgi:Zn-dependent peptidase ImmA (M78 family)